MIMNNEDLDRSVLRIAFLALEELCSCELAGNSDGRTFDEIVDNGYGAGVSVSSEMCREVLGKVQSVVTLKV